MRQEWGGTAPTPSALKLSLMCVLSISTPPPPTPVAKDGERGGDPAASGLQGVEGKS